MQGSFKHIALPGMVVVAVLKAFSDLASDIAEDQRLLFP